MSLSISVGIVIVPTVSHGEYYMAKRGVLSI